MKNGFTLIELSIVLVIIGLIIGGLLSGQSLIHAAKVRGQISQIEKYQAAVKTFDYKFNALPGDINANLAAKLGFAPRGQYAGEGDGNGVLEGVFANALNSNNGGAEGVGETVMFWSDLSYANGMNLNMIDGNFSVASSTQLPGNVGYPGSTYAINQFFPVSRASNDNYVYVYSYQGKNYFGLSANVVIAGAGGAWLGVPTGGTGGSNSTAETLPVNIAYAIDAKIDDGLPQSGAVTATYLGGFAGYIYWTYDYQNPPPEPGQIQWLSAGTNNVTAANYYSFSIPATPTSCFNNGGVVGATQQYSMNVNGGSGTNCALSFQFQ